MMLRAPERARAKLHPSLDVADDFFGCDQVRNPGMDIITCQAFVGRGLLLEESLDLFVRIPGAQVGAPLQVVPAIDASRVVQILIPDKKRGSQGPACITGRRLNPDPLKDPFPGDLAVPDAVERNTAGKAQPGLARLPRARGGRS